MLLEVHELSPAQHSYLTSLSSLSPPHESLHAVMGKCGDFK